MVFTFQFIQVRFKITILTSYSYSISRKNILFLGNFINKSEKKNVSISTTMEKVVISNILTMKHYGVFYIVIA